MLQFDYDIDDFMSYCQSQNLRPKTMQSYEQALRIFERYMMEIHNVKEASEVREGHIKEYIQYLSERGKYTVVANDHTKILNHPDNRSDHNKPMSNTSINNYLRNIKVFFNYLSENHYIKSSPFARIKRPLNNNHRPVDYLSDEAFVNLIKSFDMSKFHEYRDCTICQLLIDTGMRLGETLLIKLTDMDMLRRSIYLQPENTKSKKGRMVFYSAEMGKIIKRWLQFKDRYRDSEYLFCTNNGKPLAISNFEKNFRDYTQSVGIKKAHPHMLRNNFAKRFLMNGGDIYTLSRILGHSSVTVTEKAYLDLDNEDLRVNYAPYSPLEKIMKRK
ncbi:tyrosine-type recombinase/integrase [Caproiciproducens sp. CPB-2]|uniref:tyrosine-type recombinase/integrase n=1 Tax=Caproiciproducens sp. CPB-2 TaxID=3030017 RepID=UPI0023DBC136|nr:tyrosine-type recombinase/integrase [Caproiciproducens sp. CPB-2]MDF1496308.1 tyrosine-type recombinase/integrase [Caproiciproducens sp. CPB-2]